MGVYTHACRCIFNLVLILKKYCRVFGRANSSPFLFLYISNKFLLKRELSVNVVGQPEF